MKCVAKIEKFTKDGFTVVEPSTTVRCTDHIAEKLVSTKLWDYTQKKFWKNYGRKYRLYA